MFGKLLGGGKFVLPNYANSNRIHADFERSTSELC